MSGRNTSSTRPRSASVASNRSINASQTLLADHGMQRIAIGQRANLGSFYDARIEYIVGQLSFDKRLITKTSLRKTPECIIMKNDSFDPNDLFQKIGIHEELWLNSILNIASAEGITAMINYSFPQNKNIRFLYFYHSSEEQSIRQAQNIARSAISKVLRDVIATHVISAIKLGIQALIVLELPSHNESELDALLENKVQQLISNKFLQISRNEKPLLDQIIILEVFSNIPDLKKKSTIADICKKLSEIKPHSRCHFPLEYTLQKIKWLDPLYSRVKAQYIPLEVNTITMIKQYLLSLCDQIKELKILLDREEHENAEEYNVFRQQIVDIEQKHSAEIERIRELVLKIRYDKMKQELIREISAETSEDSLQTRINSTHACLQSLRKEKQLICQFDQKNIKYSNIQQDPIKQNDNMETALQKLHTKSKQELKPCSTDDLKNPNSSTENDQPKKCIEKPIDSSTLPDLFNQEKKLSQQKPLEPENTSTPQPFPEDRKQPTETENLCNISTSEKTSTMESMILSKRLNTSKSSKVSSAPVSTRRTNHQASTRKESCVSTVPLQTTTAEQISLLKEQPDYSAKHDSASESSPQSILDAAQSSKEQSNSINLPTSLNLSDTKRIASKEEQSVKADEQLKPSKFSSRSVSDISLTMSQQSNENSKLFNSSSASKRAGIENTSTRIERFASLEGITNQSISSTTQSSLPSKKSPSSKTENRINSVNSPNSSITENTALLNESANNKKELNSISSVPKILTPRAASQVDKESTNTNQPPKISITEGTFPSKVLSNDTNDQAFSSKSPPIVLLETSQTTDELSQNTQNQFNHLKTAEILSTEHTSSSTQQSDIQQSPRPPTSTPTPRERRRHSHSRSPSVNYINILLLGESGVGKSTFINALINYHAFETFEQAYSNKPLVVMPVSFLMTVGDNFEEKMIKFGDVDANEDHEHPGQSVTQYCRSYIFSINTQTKLRIIDTPGMGDTRGLEQDDENMQHILLFINNLSHLNAICILLKPNESRLNIVLRSYFTRLLNFLGENVRHNIVFCFTNTRATFFAPGNTGPLLKKMIKNTSIKDIPFEKTNTFCFDSESFRYLVALQNGIEFDMYQQKEYQQSWTASVTESNRFLRYICHDLKPFSQNDWQSIEHAHFKINQMIRPMLETIRNIVRNVNLLKETSSKLVIKLCPTVLSQQSAICYACLRTPKRFSDFWILPDDLHTFSSRCNDCDCDRKKHMTVNYKLEYQLDQCDEDTQVFEQMRSNLMKLRMAMLKFGQFYAYTNDTEQKNDPLLSSLKHIIHEEKQICSEKDSKCLNSTLYNIFTAIMKDYKEARTTSVDVHVPIDLPYIYEQITSISKIDEMNEQIHTIKQTQLRYLKENEKEVSKALEIK